MAYNVVKSTTINRSFALIWFPVKCALNCHFSAFECKRSIFVQVVDLAEDEMHCVMAEIKA
jgi:hypothetical protein